MTLLHKMRGVQGIVGFLSFPKIFYVGVLKVILAVRPAKLRIGAEGR